MDINISERSFSLTSEYDISAPGGDLYARKKILSFTDDIELGRVNGEHVARIKGEISPLRHKHDFTLTDGRVYHFECEKLWKRVYTCEGNGEMYRLYEHKGLNYSIFRDDRQIAAFSKNRVVWGKGNQYELRMDSDADMMVVLCMVLSTNSSEKDNEDTTVTVDLGNIGPEDRPFDPSWEPR